MRGSTEKDFEIETCKLADGWADFRPEGTGQTERRVQ
jgi:hypothetical protein